MGQGRGDQGKGQLTEDLSVPCFSSPHLLGQKETWELFKWGAAGSTEGQVQPQVARLWWFLGPHWLPPAEHCGAASLGTKTLVLWVYRGPTAPVPTPDAITAPRVSRLLCS